MLAKARASWAGDDIGVVFDVKGRGGFAADEAKGDGTAIANVLEAR